MKYSENKVRVIYGDTDAMGIVYHTNYIKWFEAGRTEFLRQLGYPYATLEKEGLWLPVAQVVCNYKRPAQYDDVLVIRSRVKELKAATVVMAYEIYRESTGECCVTGETKHGITTPDLKPLVLKKAKPELYEIMKASMEE